MDAVLLFGLLV